MIVVINTDSNTCRIYQFTKSPANISLLKEIKHSEAKLKSSEIGSDKQGSYKSDAGGHGSFSPRTEPKDVEIELFARTIAKELNHTRNLHNIQEIIIISPPHMNGVLNEHLDKHVKEMIFKNFKKDLIYMTDRELLEFLNENARFAD